MSNNVYLILYDVKCTASLRMLSVCIIGCEVDFELTLFFFLLNYCVILCHFVKLDAKKWYII
jgi:hypothetical protein